jgi:hypothetical protein
MIPIHLAVEDLLSERIARRLLEDSGRPFHVISVLSRGGYGYLKSKIAAFNQSANNHLAFFVLTDLDKAPCPSGLVHQWLPKTQSPNLLFRVAVREVEAWLIADTINFASFLGISVDKVPINPEALDDPKRTLIQLAAKAGRADRKRRIVPRSSSGSVQGQEYNSCLSEFVESHWNPSAASLNSQSLARCIHRIAHFQVES